MYIDIYMRVYINIHICIYVNIYIYIYIHMSYTLRMCVYVFFTCGFVLKHQSFMVTSSPSGHMCSLQVGLTQYRWGMMVDG